jgi:hypothetical protein
MQGFLLKSVGAHQSPKTARDRKTAGAALLWQRPASLCTTLNAVSNSGGIESKIAGKVTLSKITVCAISISKLAHPSAPCRLKGGPAGEIMDRTSNRSYRPGRCLCSSIGNARPNAISKNHAQPVV